MLGIGDTQLVESDRAEARIGNVRRYRRGAIGRPESAGDKAAAAIFFLCKDGRFSGKRRTGLVQLVSDALHAIVGLGDRCRGECIGGNDVCTGAKVSEMDVADGVRPAQIEQVVVTAHLTVPGVEARAAVPFFVELEALDHGAHGTIEHKDALPERLSKF